MSKAIRSTTSMKSSDDKHRNGMMTAQSCQHSVDRAWSKVCDISVGTTLQMNKRLYYEKILENFVCMYYLKAE